MAQVLILNGPKSRADASRLCQVAPPGSVCEIKPPRRTNDQNAKMHAMLSDIARAKPFGRKLSKDDWKAVFMDALARETGESGFQARWEPGLEEGTVVNLGFRSSRLTKAQMSAMIERIHAFAAEHGIELSE